MGSTEADRPIQFFNRYTGQVENEKVYGEGFLKWVYGNPLGQLSLHALVKRAAFSKWYGWRMNRPGSRSKIWPFIEQYSVDPKEFVRTPDQFEHFNAFFSRELKPIARPVSPGPAIAVFPADGRHLAVPTLSEMDRFFVKGQRFDLEKLLGSPELAKEYQHGTLVLSRLCPVDYHAYHFPLAGEVGTPIRLSGDFCSVSPIALRQRLAYLWENERCLTILDTANFGKVLLLEIAATCVGSMSQEFEPGSEVDKGQKKGTFRFGGSSTITVFKEERIQLEEDILRNSKNCMETYAKMGDPMGRSQK